MCPYIAILIFDNLINLCIMVKNVVNFGVKNHMIHDYIDLLYEAINTSVQNTDYFIINYNKTNL